jgi:hypothetical protein
VTEDETPEAESQKDETPEQFKAIRASLHAERERVMALAQDWRPNHFQDIRDSRSPQLLGETLLSLGEAESPVTSEDGTVRMQKSLGSLSKRQDLLEGVRG